MNVASIDIGTNTVILLICKLDEQSKQLKELESRYLIPRIGKGLVNGAPFNVLQIQKLEEVLYKYSDII
ncbi:MAG: hypothetical protein K9I99_16670, partial [Melioribacteraceae bacterium]|nr:hypothetical protein [Melioribacteraceae bacterium]